MFVYDSEATSQTANKSLLICVQANGVFSTTVLGILLDCGHRPCLSPYFDPDGLNLFHLCAAPSCTHCDRTFHNLVGRSCGRAKRNTSDVGTKCRQKRSI